MEWFKKLVDTMTVTVIGAIMVSMVWMNGRFNDLKKDIAVIKIVLILKQATPCELAESNTKQPL